jgi:tetratricopeptide (TPR) repeat protein
MSIDSTIERRMTRPREVSPQTRFIGTVLPWLIAGASLLLYLLTLNHWVSLSSLLPVARTSGWIWQPSFSEPLYWLVTSPLRLLPPAVIPVALNLFSAICAALSLALLARSVALWPHDRTKEERIRLTSPVTTLAIPTAWIPPLVAAAVCGFQLTFWENATAASMQMLDLLLFAYVIRCLLEFRIDQRDSWMLRASFVYGLGMANDWAMIGFFPVFLGALIWIRKLSFFEPGFLGRMFIAGVSGLSLYLLLPVISLISGGVEVSFWQALRINLSTQKNFLTGLLFNKDALINGERPLWVLGLPSLLPMLAVSIRWPSFMGDINKVGVALANLAFHIINGVLLVVCLWVALDPQFSPRHYQPLLSQYGILLLPFYYLGALSIGYFIGYYLYVFGVMPSGRQRFRKSYPPLVNHAVVFLVYALAVITPTLLLWRNFSLIRITNGSELRDFASLVTEKLPTGHGIVLSDDPRRLLLMQSALTQAGRAKDYVMLDTGSLEFPGYFKFLKRAYPTRWDIMPPKEVKNVASADLQRIVYSLARSNTVAYLHPSFGYYFEGLYPVTHGMVYQLELYTGNSVLAPPPTPAIIAENSEFWTKAEERTLRQVAAAVEPAAVSQTGLLDRVSQTLHLVTETNRDSVLLGTFYSQALNFWGVQLQRLNQFPQAGEYFNRALQLNPENVVAEVNLGCNRNLQAGRQSTVQLSKAIEEKFGHRTWDQMMRENGPFDEPNFCFAQGNAFMQGGNSHQAALQFERVRALQPENVQAQIALAQLYFFNRVPDEALKVISELHTRSGPGGLNHSNAVQVLGIEASAHLVKGDLKAAEATIDGATLKFPQDSEVLATATKVYLDFGLYTNALRTVEQQLQAKPEDQAALFYKGNVCLQLNSFAEAIPPLTRLIDLETNNFSKTHYLAQFMRAKAYLGEGKLNEAKQDYLTLSKALPHEFPVYFDLAGIAYREQDTNAAVQYYQLYKANAPTNFVEDLKLADSRLAELKRGSP